MSKTMDMGWLHQLGHASDDLPMANHSEEFPWYPSAWLFRAVHQRDEQAHPYLLQFIDNPRLLHWLLRQPMKHDMVQDMKASLAKANDADDIAIPSETDVLDANNPGEAPNPPVADEERMELAGESTDDEAEALLPDQTAVLDAPAVHAMNSRLGDALKNAAAALEGPVDDAGGLAPAFQPHHTVDYFEAVGIRLRDATEKDKLYSQVKSFTQWLRAMKRINYQTGTVEEDKAVTEKATASLSDERIKTETMADVLIKQGKLEEAAAIFTELQLLYPDKSAYFAARLENLKLS